MSNIDFLEENMTKAKIKVIGVGGCGGNAVNAMLDTSLEGEVGLYAVNTDAQALGQLKPGCERIQIGQQVAKGLGVGADYQLAFEAAKQERDRLEQIIDGADMVFIAAGMGGGTGTGASPFIAELCQERKILTVAVVTKPYQWEGREANVKAGIAGLGQFADSIIVVPNDRIADVHGHDIPMSDAFRYSDEILINAVASICEIIYRPGQINVDFADVKRVMSEKGQALLGTATESGVDRAARAAEAVTECPLLEGIEMANAQGLLVNITASRDSITSAEVDQVMKTIRARATDNPMVFFGLVYGDDMGDKLRITLIATGLGRKQTDINKTSFPARPAIAPRAALLKSNRKKDDASQASLLGEEGQIPTMLRRQHS